MDASESDAGKRMLLVAPSLSRTLLSLLDPFAGKGKDKKEPTRQSTLFGLPMGKPAERKKKKTTNDSSQVTSVEPEGDCDTRTPSTQASDMTMTDAPSEATWGETQPTEQQVETQPDVSESMHVDGNNVRDFH